MAPRISRPVLTPVSTWIYVAALVIISLVSRLPQLVSPNLLLDGDECILGLMAKHVMEAREFPVFFYGQNYGLAIVEAPAAALSFLLFGVGVLPLKLAILALWIAGVVFYFLALSRPLGRARSFWITLLLVLMPAWAVSSMKAWSGYVTAFTATGALLYVLMRTDRPRTASWVIAGCLTAIIYFAQPLWLPGVLSIVGWFLWREGRGQVVLLYSAGIGLAAALVVSLNLLPSAAAISWQRPDVGNPDLFGSIGACLRQIHTNFTGSYYLRAPVTYGPVTGFVARLWTLILIALLLLQVRRPARDPSAPFSRVLAVSVVATLLANWLLLEGRDGRYLLPLNALVVLLAGVEFARFDQRSRAARRLATACVAAMLGLQAVAMGEFAQYAFMWWKDPGRGEARSLETVVGHLEANGVRHVVSMNALLQWQLMFYSREAIIARWTAEHDRYPPYVAEVNEAIRSGGRTAVVGYTGYMGGLDSMVADAHAIRDIDGKYVVYIGPIPAALLRRQ
jgi:hypothetical protein